MKTADFLFIFASTLASSALSASAAEKASSPPAAPPFSEAQPDAGEAVDVSNVQNKYWAQGKDTELGVVQNRKYTNANRVELEVFAGTISTDPFLSVKSLGFSLGYHFNPYFSVHAIGWRAMVSPSSAQQSFQVLSGATVSTNPPKGFYGAQADWSFLYGKASLLGSAIIYVDLFLLGGAGITDTSTGRYLTPFFGIGQKIHLNSFMALALDYRIMSFSEKVLNQGVLRERSNRTDAITLGLSFYY